MDDFEGAICCASCGEVVERREPNGWWASELDSMKQNMDEMQCKLEVAEDEAADAHDRCVEMEADVRDAKQSAEAIAHTKNFRITDRLMTYGKVIELMDNMIRSDGPPTCEELNKLNNLRTSGGLNSI